MGVSTSTTGELRPPDEPETIAREFKEATIIPGHRATTQDEESNMRYNMENTIKFLELANMSYARFIDLLTRCIPKGFACAINGVHALEIIFGVTDKGRTVGLPIMDIKTTIQIISDNINTACQSICNSTHTNLVKRTALLTCMRDFLVARVVFSPVTYTPGIIAKSKHTIEKSISVIEHERKKACILRDKKLQHDRDKIERSRYINKSADDAINGDGREPFLAWIEYSKHPVIGELEHKYPLYFSTLRDILTKKKDECYQIIEVDTSLFKQCINDTLEEKKMDHILVILIATYKESLKQMLKDELKKTPELKIDAPRYPYSILAKTKRLDLMCLISEHVNMYTCSISLDQLSVQRFLHNVHNQHLAENGFLLQCGNNVCLLTRSLDKYNEPTTETVVVSTRHNDNTSRTSNNSKKRKLPQETQNMTQQRVCV